MNEQTNEQMGAAGQPPIPAQVRQPAKRKSGCWKWAAIGCAAVIVLAAVGGYLAYRGVKGLIAGMVEAYTFAEPMELPQVQISAEEEAEVLGRVDRFVDALEGHGSPQPLVLTSRDLNVLINRHPRWQALAGKVHVIIEDDKIAGQASIPLDDFGALFAGRHLNGSVVFRLDMLAGRLLVFLDSVEVGGEPLPEEFMSALRAQNLAEEVNKQPDSIEVLEKLESISVEDGRLTIVPRS